VDDLFNQFVAEVAKQFIVVSLALVDNKYEEGIARTVGEGINSR